MRSLLTAIALLLASQVALAQTFQWESLSIADEAAIPTGTVGSMGCGTLAVRVDWSVSTSGGGSFVAFAGSDFVSYEAGQLGAHTGQLVSGFDNASADVNDVITITLSFNDDVDDLAFALTDIDTGSWDDGIEVFYNGANNTKGSAFVSFTTPPVYNDNETYMEGYEGGGTSVAASSASGNVNLDFGAGGGVSVNEIVITYRSTDDADTNPGGQLIGITDLSFSCNNPTAVLITDVRQMSNDRETWVEWDTAWQASTAGFFVYRWDRDQDEYVALHQGLVSALGQPDGGVFAAADPQAPAGTDAWYLVEEIRTDDGSAFYGPFLAEAVETDEDPRSASRSERFVGRSLIQRSEGTWSRARAMDSVEVERLNAALLERSSIASARLDAGSSLVSTTAAVSAARARTDLKLEVDPGTVVAVSFGELVNLWGLTERQVEWRAARGKFRLMHGGKQVPWTVLGNQLVFYARDEEPKYSYTTNYMLSLGSGSTMEQVKAMAKPRAAASAVRVREKSEVDVTALTANEYGSEEDLYFWEMLIANNPVLERKSFTVDVEERHADTEIDISVEVLGVAVGTEGLPQHRFVAFSGATELGELTWSSRRPSTTELTVPQGVLEQGPLSEIELELAPVEGATGTLAFVDSVTIGYTRSATLSTGAMAFTPLDGGIITVGEVEGSSLVVLDVTDPKTPKRLAYRLASGGGELAFKASSDHRYVVASDAGIAAPLSMAASNRGGEWRQRSGAEYVVVAPRHLLDGAHELAAFRSEYSTMVVAAEDLYDFYTDGAVDPAAIRRFLRWADRRWQTKPAFVALIGGASYDRKNLNGLGENVMPTFFARTPHGLFSTDIPFADTDGDRVPDLAIGRIPAVTNIEVSTYVRKLREQSAPAGDFRASLLADNADSAGNFASDSAELMARFESSADVSVNEYQVGNQAGFAAQLQQDVADGLHWGNYFGHGGVDRLASESLLSVANVGSLQGAYLPTITALTCQIGRLEFPGYLSLGEALVLEDGAGATAVWGASGLSQQAEAQEIADAFIEVHGEQANLKLGQAINAALSRYAEGSPVAYMQTLYTLFGDPALDSPLAFAPVVSGAGDAGAKEVEAPGSGGDDGAE